MEARLRVAADDPRPYRARLPGFSLQFELDHLSGSQGQAAVPKPVADVSSTWPVKVPARMPGCRRWASTLAGRRGSARRSVGCGDPIRLPPGLGCAQFQLAAKGPPRNTQQSGRALAVTAGFAWRLDDRVALQEAPGKAGG